MEDISAVELNGNHLLVYEAVKTHRSKYGISLQALRDSCIQIPANDLSTIIECLASDGHIYSSIDSEHFLATDPLPEEESDAPTYHFGLSDPIISVSIGLIYQAVKIHSTKNGISLRELRDKFRDIPVADLMTILEYLASEGHIYNSIDCEHFLATDPLPKKESDDPKYHFGLLDQSISSSTGLIYDAVKTHSSENGISFRELQDKFSHISAADLMTIVEYLVLEGDIYSSIDSEHFLATDPE